MHIFIPHAGIGGPRCAGATDSLKLPQLRAIAADFAGFAVAGNPASLTPLHECLRAQSAGLPSTDGLVPWAALEAHTLQLPGASTDGWARLSLCHWTINADHVEMSDPQMLQVTPEESLALMNAMRAYFAEDGIALHASTDVHWLASGEVFRRLTTASLERACGTQVDAWMPRQPEAKPLRRLQNEMQMLLYTHPINDARALTRLPAINSFWVSDTGSLSAPLTSAAEPAKTIDWLREPALRDDDRAWLAAWSRIDTEVLAPLRARDSAANTWQLTLCGDNAAQTFTNQPQSWLRRMTNRLQRPDIKSLLQSL